MSPGPRSLFWTSIAGAAALAATTNLAAADSLKLPPRSLALPPAASPALPCTADPSAAHDAAKTDGLDRGQQAARIVSFCVSGTFKRPLYGSLAAAGIPAAVRDEMIEAYINILDLVRDVSEGDGFYVRFEQAMSGTQGAWRAAGPGRLLWAEVRSHNKGTLSVHRFMSNDGGDRFWTSAGKAAVPPQLRGPLTHMNVSSGFGMRPDPFGEGTSKHLGMGGPPETASVQMPAAHGDSVLDRTVTDAEPAKDEPKKEPPKRRRSSIAFSGLGGSGSSGADFANGRRALGREAFVETQPAPEAAPHKEDVRQPEAPAPKPRLLFMHSGVDLVAPTGTPIFAAADGVVVGAHPNGPYGNWIRIDHPGRVTTIYGHLSKYEPAVYPGATVTEGQLIGYVGNTGRSTGSHLHFEVWRNGIAVDPLRIPEMKPPILNWAELQRFKSQVSKATAQRGVEVAEGSQLFE